jgi:hypothetical protein
MVADEEVPMTLIDFERPEVSDDRATAAATAPPAPAIAPETPARPPRRRMFADLAGPLSRTWGFALVAAWVVVVAVGLAVEPAPVNPDAPVPLVATLLSNGLLMTWGAMAAGVFQRRRFAAASSLVGGVGLLALTLGCPLSGHHTFGAWWGVQLVGAVGLLALSRRALRSS